MSIYKTLMNNEYSKKALEYLKNDIQIDIKDFINKISKETPNDIDFFIDLIYFMKNIENTEEIGIYDKINEEFMEFYKIKTGETEIDETTARYQIFNVMRHCCLNFKEDGIMGAYKRSEGDIWYPKIIITEFMGKKEDIELLDDEIIIYRGTSLKEFNSNKFRQSWTLDKEIASKFAYRHYTDRKGIRVILETKIKKNDIFYYDKNDNEKEIIVNNLILNQNNVKIIDRKMK